MKYYYGVTYDDEIWKPLNYRGNILDRYSVSNYGRVYDNHLQQPSKFNHLKGLYNYFRVYLGPNEDRNCSAHRAVMMSFEPISNFNEMQINHIDGNPLNNTLINLEWCTPIHNTRHAIDNGLYNGVGMANGKARYSDEEVHEICKLIDQGVSVPHIADALGHFEQEERNIFCANVRNIKKGKTRTHISKDYNFMKEHKRDIRYSLEFAHLVCQFLSNPNKDFTYKEIMDLLQIPNEERLTFKFYVEDLIKGKTAKSVSEQYILKKPLDYYEKDIEKYAYLMS